MLAIVMSSPYFGAEAAVINCCQTVTVNYVVQWKQEDGDWKWHVDIWNANE